MQEMLAIMGCSYEELRGVLTALGFESKIRDLSQYPSLSEMTEDTPPEAVNSEKTESTTPETTEAEKSETKNTQTEIITPPTEATNQASSESPSASDTVAADTTPAQKAKQSPTHNKKPPKPLNIYNHRDVKDDGTTVEIENNEFWLMPPRKKPAHNNRSNKKHQGKKFNNKTKNRQQNYQSTKPKQSVENSPFAALAALKADKKD